jgi:putative transferase (TIGR04331 family)
MAGSMLKRDESMSKSVSTPASLFLATTSLQSAWPERGPDVFLGEWCLEFPEDAQRVPGSAVMPYPWHALELRTKALEYCVALALRIAKGLAPFYSTLLGEELSEREVNILLAATPGRMVMAAYHDFVCLQAAVAKYGRLRTVGLGSDDYIVPETTELLIDQLRRDDFHLQLFSEISPLLGIALERRSRRDLGANSVAGARAGSPSTRPRRSSPSKALRTIAKKISRLQARHADCILYNSSFSTPEACSLAAKSRFRVATLPLFKMDAIAWPRPSAALRTELAERLGTILNGDVFEQVLCKLLPAIWPVSLLEGLGQLKTAVAAHFPSPPKTIATAMALNNDDAFRLWCVHAHKRGARLLDCQHGGGYGKRHSPDLAEHMEYRIADKFISWGGSGDLARSTVTLPVPPHFFVKRRSATDGRMLYLGTSVDRWPSNIAHFPFGPMVLPYLDRQVAFWRALPSELQPKLLLRANPGDAGWSETRRLRRQAPQLELDDFQRSFAQSIGKARLVIVDNLNTAFLQSMGSGIPTILVWDPEVWAVNKAARTYFDALETAGVFFRSPEAAAAAAARIWQDPQGWWETPAVAAPVNEFVDFYMTRSRDWARPWLGELLH